MSSVSYGSRAHGYARASLAIAITAALLVIIAPVRANADAAAESFIRRVSGEIISVMKSSAGDSQKRARFSSLFSRYADAPAIGVFSLGSDARKLGSRRGEYLRLMRRYISVTFSRHMNDINGERLTIKDSIRAGKKDSLVRSTLHFKDGRTAKINWRVVRRSSGMKIFDVIIDGLSLVQAQKSAFRSRVKDAGIGGLMSWLKKAS